LRPVAAAVDSAVALRLPNAPELFEGRDRELRWLVERLRAHRPSTLWSPPGLGKTGLALRALADARSAVSVSVTDYATEAAFLGALYDALARAAADPAPRARSAITAAERIAAIVARLEQLAVPVLVEDLHGLPEATAESLLLGVARHCRRATFVATTRRRPKHDDLIEHTLRLEPLTDDAVARIVRHLRPDIDPARLAEVVASAAGSPRLARQNALGLDARRSVLEGVAPGSSALVRALSELEAPIDASGGPDGDREVADLIDGGFVERTADGLRIVDSLRDLVRAGTLDRTASRREALRMAASDPRPGASFEVLRLALEIGDRAAAEVALAKDGAALLHMGYGEALFAIITRHGAQRGSAVLGSSCLAIADWLRSGPSLEWACEQPEPASSRDRLIWCRLRALGGDVRGAEEASERLASELTEPDAHAEAASLHADIVSWSGDAARAVALLDAIDAPKGRLSVDRDLRLVVALVRAGDAARAAVVVRSAIDDYDRLDPPVRLALREPLLSALLAASSFRGIERLLGTADPVPGAPTSEVFASLAMATERGHVALARRVLAVARVGAEGSAALRFAAGYNDLRLRTAFGPFEGLVAEGRRTIAAVERCGVKDFVAYLHGAQAAAAIAVGEIDDAPRAEAKREGEGSALLAHAWHAIVGLRRGNVPERIGSTGKNAFEVELAVTRYEIEHDIATDDLAVAAQRIDEVLDRARDEGLVLDELTFLALRVDVSLLRGPDHARAADRHADDLHARATAVGSRRFELEAQLAKWSLSSPRPADVLLTLAESNDGPVARRRALALLARPSRLDTLDARVVAAMSTRRGLLLDVARKCVELPGGRRVELGGSSLHVKLLEAFFQSGGAASKEALARRVWDLRTYHPHRDDKRIQVAIHRLRHAIEDDPANPRIIVRVGDDYRVTSDIALRRLD
jgi:hypothetical protein